MKQRILLILLTLWTACDAAMAQVQSASGVVYSGEDNLPLIGASVRVKNTTIGVTADMDGKFTLQNIPAEAKSLEISYIGFRTQTVAIKNGFKITLQPDSKEMDEVVVTGMQKMDKRLFSGASTKLDAEKMKIDGIADISRSLEGRAAGVSVQNVSGTFGTAPKIRIRGATSIYGSSTPLWVIDGVPVANQEVSADALATGDIETLLGSAVAGLNADDIESFQILKDGSATSIYGARAMAGVIVITTKKGRSGQSKINYTGEFTMRLKPSYNNYNIMNSQDQMAVYEELSAKGWLNFSGDNVNGLYNAANSGVYGKMWHLINTYNPTTGQFALANTPEARTAYLQSAEKRNTDWFDELFSNSVMHNHSVSITSGSDKAVYYASLSVMQDPGWYKQSKTSRYTANLNATFNISKHLSLNLLSNTSYRRQRAPGTSGQSVDVVNGAVSRDFDINPFSYALNTSRTLDPNETYTRNYADFNIFRELDNNYIEINEVQMKVQGELKWKPIKELELSALGSLTYDPTSIEHHVKDDSNQANAYRAMGNSIIRDQNDKLYTDPDNPYALPISVLPEGGIYQRMDQKNLGWYFRAAGSWTHLWKENHMTNVYGGMEATSTDVQNTNFYGWGMQYNMGEVPYYIYQYFKQGIERGSQYYSLSSGHLRTTAFFFNANYSYKERYSVNGTFRYDGTNRLGAHSNARWLPTWNGSARWNFSEEGFFEPLKKVVSTGSLRASYSLTGDRGPDLTNSAPVIYAGTTYRPFTSVQESYLYLSQLENSELTYEKKHELNIGLDLGFLNNRINLEMDWFTRNNFDLIGYTNTQGVGGEIKKTANISSMKSHGFELSLSTLNLKKKHFSWNTDFMFTHVTTEVTDLSALATTMDYVSGTGFTLVGLPHRGLFSVKFAGLDKEGIPTFYNEKGELTSTDINLQGSDNFDWLQYEGPTEPTFFGSFGNTFRYKGWNLNVYFTFSGGNKVRLDPVFSATYNDQVATSREFKNRWTQPGDEHKTNIPAILSYRQYHDRSDLRVAYNVYNYSTERVADGGFIRLKEISLSYDFPKKWMDALKVSTMSLKMQATNLCLLYADKKLNGQDPEFVNSGGVASPVPKQFTLTLRLGL